MSDDTTKKVPPAYVPFPTFFQFIQNMKKTAVPPRIDRTVLTSMSGATQNQLLSSLRFLHLIDHDSARREPLIGLVQAIGTPGWPKAFASVLTAAYKDILAGLDLRSGTAGQLREQFKKGGASDGLMTDRSIRFFLSALKSAEISFSPHFKVANTAAARKPPGRKKATSSASNGSDDLPADDDPPETDKDNTEMVVIPIPFKNRKAGKLVAPKNLDESDMQIVNLAVQMLAAYATQDSAK